MFNKLSAYKGAGIVLATLLTLTLASCGDDDDDMMMDDDSMDSETMSDKMAAPMMGDRDAGMAPSSAESMNVRLLRTALRGVVNNPMVSSWVSSDAFVSDFVRLVININQKQVKQSLSDFGDFKAQGFQALIIDNKPYLGTSSFNRYRALASMVDVLDARSLVDLYGRAEQLMQSEYSSYGIPASRGNFKEQLKRAIDKVAAVNVSQNRVPLTQDSVVFHYESSSLERASDLEKLMYRLGPRNSRMIQSKLREIRSQL